MAETLGLNKQEKKKRIPLGASRDKGAVSDKDPAYVYRWVNASPGRVAMALNGGYEHVKKDGVKVGTNGDKNNNLGSMVSQYAGRDEQGLPYDRYLMRIRREFYEEDQRSKQSAVDNVDRAIRAGKFKRGANPNTEYVPNNGIKIDVSH